MEDCMDWVHGEIAIGHVHDSQNRGLLEAQGIQAILSLDGSAKGRSAEDYGVRELVALSLIDGPGNDPRHIQWAVDSLERLVDDSPPVLVHCHAGRSRSAVVVARFLMKRYGLSRDQALGQIAGRRDIQVSDGLWRC